MLKADSDGTGEWTAFEYPSCGDPAAAMEWQDQAARFDNPSLLSGIEVAASPGQEELNQSSQGFIDEVRQSFEAGREQGRTEGRQLEREAHAAALSAAESQRRLDAIKLIEEFAQERNRYLQAVEHEVVELALLVAARILRREAQMAPLLLTGAVRVALGQLAAGTNVRLHVPASELSLWKETLALLPNLAVKPTVEAGNGMRAGECVIDTDLGTVDLGMRAQLAEIERGFFDRVGKAPIKHRDQENTEESQ